MDYCQKVMGKQPQQSPVEKGVVENVAKLTADLCRILFINKVAGPEAATGGVL